MARTSACAPWNSRLKAGDEVVVTFTEALAVSVEPAR
jgi:hypothetical protein